MKQIKSESEALEAYLGMILKHCGTKERDVANAVQQIISGEVGK